MSRFTPAPRRLAALALVLLVATTLGACSRKNNVLSPVVTGPVTWDNTVRHLIADRSEGTAPTGCTSCHHTGTTISDWTVYANVYGDRDSIFSTIQPGGRMRRFLKPGEPQVIMDWITAGAPEN